jgi:mono/diheme cytochrome c family protein
MKSEIGKMKRLAILAAVLAVAVASCGGSDSSGDDTDGDAAPAVVGPADAANGAKVYDSTCVACHGRGGSGIEGLGKPMPGSPFIASLADDELVAFIKEGRSSDHPDNTTGIEMPAKGGNTNLTEQELVDVVAYIRTL